MNTTYESNRFELNTPIKMSKIGLAHFVSTNERDLPVLHFNLYKTIYKDQIFEQCRKLHRMFDHLDYFSHFSCNEVTISEHNHEEYTIIEFASTIVHNTKKIYHQISLKSHRRHTPTKYTFNKGN